MNDDQKAQTENSQHLEELYENDGSNLRIQGDPKNFANSTVLQIIRYTHTDENDPVEAILSDGHTSVKATFSSDAVETFRRKHQRKITSRTQGGIISVYRLEIVISLFGSGEDDRVTFLVKSMNFRGSPGAAIRGNPRPIQERPKIQRYLALLGVKIEDESDVEGTQLLNEPELRQNDPLEEVLSQGEQEPMQDASLMTQTQFDTQMVHPSQGQPMTPVRPVGDVNLARPQPSNAGQSTDVRESKHSQLLNLLKKSRPTLPAIPPTTTNGPQRNQHDPKLAIKNIGTQNPKHALGAEKSSGVGNKDTANVGGDDILKTTERGNSQIRSIAAIKKEPSQRDDKSKDVPSSSMPVVDGIPTSYQKARPISSLESNGSNAAPAIEKEHSPTAQTQLPQSSGNDDGPWKTALPLTRATCRIPSNQRRLLNKPLSWFPPRVGHGFFPAIPVEILNSFSGPTEAKKERRRSGSREDSDSGDDLSDSSNASTAKGPDAAPFSPSKSEEKAVEAPPSSQEIPWSSSPVRPVKRQADLPPDSSAEELRALTSLPSPPKQDEVEHAVSPILSSTMPPPKTAYKGTVALEEQADTRVASSPDLPSSPPPLPPNEDEMANAMVENNEDENNEDDLEMDVPKAFTKTNHPERFSTEPDAMKETGLRTDRASQKPSHSKDLANEVPSMTLAAPPVGAFQKPSYENSTKPSKRDIVSPTHNPHKKLKYSHASYGFSQESPVVQDPAMRLRQGRNKFMTEMRARRSMSSSQSGSGEVRQNVLGSSDNDDHIDEPKAVKNKNDDEEVLKDAPVKQIDQENPPANPVKTTGSRSADEKIEKDRKVSEDSVSKDKIPEEVKPAGEEKPEKEDIFGQFCEKYPEYSGDRKHFTGLCRMIHKLQSTGAILPKFLWDDFILRHKVEYREYIAKCSDEGQDPVSYQAFYNEEIDEPKYQKRFMNGGKLHRVLELEDGQAPKREPVTRFMSETYADREQPAPSQYGPDPSGADLRGDYYRPMYAQVERPKKSKRSKRKSLPERVVQLQESEQGRRRNSDAGGSVLKRNADAPLMMMPLPAKPVAAATKTTTTSQTPRNLVAGTANTAPKPSKLPKPSAKPAAAPTTSNAPTPTPAAAPAAPPKPATTTTATAPKPLAPPTRKRASSSANTGSAAKKPAVENSFTIFKQRYNKPRPGGGGGGGG
ncbi:uncharacterized protein K452DRAFT_44896 [Aplosporella prunicola CBS 121167]|uniref:Shelterin complex subunit TPP1/Est3 domain-containing protein n=1 Tax=Aplosporella prunicola CBS 121167 TaxID=1176127 RepID=A0A6A6BCR5_9PEZI|nr:uncharacterized protein K452DRAFT_44896 [Aplosporella prunicola CBS 121167]KAF2141075.1 hypothetical protein K452DRAFT_44896 [Aplosporella prunicola CBS 121167]